MTVHLEFRRITSEDGRRSIDLELAENERVEVLGAQLVGPAVQFDVVIVEGAWRDAA